MFFESWFGLLRVVVVGTLAYFGLVLLLRVSGKRTLSKMNAFDLVVTVAMGSTLANALLSEDVALLEALLAFALLIGLQWLVAWAGSRSSRLEQLIKGVAQSHESPPGASAEPASLSKQMNFSYPPRASIGAYMT